MAGKGDKQRPVDKDKFDNNYCEINWNRSVTIVMYKDVDRHAILFRLKYPYSLKKKVEDREYDLAKGVRSAKSQYKKYLANIIDFEEYEVKIIEMKK